MCGIVAIASPERPILAEALNHATQRLSYRGPDNQSQWIAAHRRVGLGHTRLSIIDLATGDQPIANEDGQLHLVVNGEFYDFERIQQDLERRGHQLRTRSDSEIVLHLYEEYGVQCLHHLRGEFAFILWDESRRQLFAARDRFGVKPLFYSSIGDTVYLASEAKALFAAGVPAQWDRDSVFQQLFIGLAGDRTLFQNIRQVPPGHYLLMTPQGIRLDRYWDLDYPTIDASAPNYTDAEYIEKFRQVLEEAVKLRIRADVPVGCFLSGGIDSSTALGIAAKYSPEPLKAFTVTFEQSAYNEGGVAQETAAHVGADFQPIPLNPADFASHIADAIWHAETLGVNPHGIARYLQSCVVHESGYKVVLSGEGADEILAGYSHARQDFRLSQFAQKPRKNGTPLMTDLTSNDIPAALANVQQRLGFMPTWLKEMAVSRSFFYLLLAPEYASEFTNRDVYGEFLQQFDLPGQLVGRDPFLQSLYLWSRSILPNYILFAERLEMAHAVEVRLPFLDHHVVELVREIPTSLLIRGNQEKYLLRQAARPFLTDTVYARPKQPFTAPPVTLTTTNPLYTLMQDSLRSSNLASVPFFDPAVVITLLDQLPEMSER
ncbi:MAG: asparagine synthase (glutamine-hydrolyzing), partial [Pseudanabaenales cyanobacterium]|nr:asparagine synthase (glutamine-hydrolyzing) [Pseudanabaenales cyanobacterium]